MAATRAGARPKGLPLANTYLLSGDDQDIIGTLATIIYDGSQHEAAIELLPKPVDEMKKEHRNE